MTITLQNNESICDLKGTPLSPESTILLHALNKMLMVGAYYSSDHDQYIQASIKSCQEIQDIAGPANQSFVIEITAQGLMVGGQIIEPYHRQVRLLYELLVPLNIAQLKISKTLTSDDLRDAISIFQDQRMDLGQSSSFHEILFDNLPASVQATSCSVLQQSDDPLGTGAVNLNELLGSWDEQDFSLTGQKDKSSSEKLASQFMEMITQILENIEKFEDSSQHQESESHDGSFATREDLVSLRQALQKMVEINPDPEELTKLINQAQRALHLSQDAKSVNLAFSILKKDMAKKNKTKAPSKAKKSSSAGFKFTVDELLSMVEELEKTPSPIDDPWDLARSNQLVITLQLLRSDPPTAQRTGMMESITSIIDRPDFSEHNLFICAQFFNAMARDVVVDDMHQLLASMMETIREKRSAMIAPFWIHLTELTGEEYLPRIWPCLVNDILLGFDGAPRNTVKKLALAAGQITLTDAKKLGSQLERQPALQKSTGARDLFVAPPTSLYPVHAVLKDSSLSDWLGLELHRSFCANPTSRLMEVLMVAIQTHDPQYLDFYLDLIKHHKDQNHPPEFRDQAVELLQDVLVNASSERRNENWVPKGLIELGQLDPDGIMPLLDRIIHDRKFFFFKAWPEPIRKMAMDMVAKSAPGGA
jgi:hypothetical protein